MADVALIEQTAEVGEGIIPGEIVEAVTVLGLSDLLPALEFPEDERQNRWLLPSGFSSAALEKTNARVCLQIYTGDSQMVASITLRRFPVRNAIQSFDAEVIVVGLAVQLDKSLSALQNKVEHLTNELVDLPGQLSPFACSCKESIRYDRQADGSIGYQERSIDVDFRQRIQDKFNRVHLGAEFRFSPDGWKRIATEKNIKLANRN